MVKLRLTRFGQHKRPYYRLVAVDARAKLNGAYIELLGHIDPLKDEVKLNEAAILNQLSLGAQPSETVKNLLRENGIWKKHTDAKLAAKSKK